MPVLAGDRGLRGVGLVVHEVLPGVPIEDLRRERDDLGPGEVLGGRGGPLGELAEPDVAVAHGVVVVLERDRAAAALVGRTAATSARRSGPNGSSLFWTRMPLWNTVIRAGSTQLAGGVEPGAAEGDVVGLPLAGRARRR